MFLRLCKTITVMTQQQSLLVFLAFYLGANGDVARQILMSFKILMKFSKWKKSTSRHSAVSNLGENSGRWWAFFPEIGGGGTLPNVHQKKNNLRIQLHRQSLIYSRQTCVSQDGYAFDLFGRSYKIHCVGHRNKTYLDWCQTVSKSKINH